MELRPGADSAPCGRGELASQMVAPVEWVGSVREMVANGVDTFVEIGPGHVLSRLIRRISTDVKAISFNDAVDRTALKPVATVYKDVTPSFVQTGVNNFFGNLSDVWSSANNFAQQGSQ